MAQASKNQAVEPDTEQGAKAPIDTEEILDDDDALDVEPDVGASDTLDDDKLEAGLDEDGHPRTLEEVGREFGVTRERIRQIESKTLAKLRHPSRSSKLNDYLED